MYGEIIYVVKSTGIQHQVRLMDYPHCCQLDSSTAWGTQPTRGQLSQTEGGFWPPALNTRPEASRYQV